MPQEQSPPTPDGGTLLQNLNTKGFVTLTQAAKQFGLHSRKVQLLVKQQKLTLYVDDNDSRLRLLKVAEIATVVSGPRPLIVRRANISARRAKK